MTMSDRAGALDSTALISNAYVLVTGTFFCFTNLSTYHFIYFKIISKDKITEFWAHCAMMVVARAKTQAIDVQIAKITYANVH